MANERATYYLELKDRGYFSTLDKADSKLNRFENHVNRVNGRRGGGGLSALSGAFGMAARAAGTLGLAIGAVGLGKSIVQLGTDMEQTRVAFATMFGTIEEGNRVINELNEFANVTPFDNAKVIQSAKTLAAFGLQANELRPTLKLLGDVSAGTGKDLAEMAVIFGQIKSAGRLMGQDLLQLINAGFNPLQEISAKTGRSVMDLKKDMEKGLISFDMVQQAFRDATSEGGKFFNLMERQSKTVAGRFSTLLGKLQMIGIKIGEALLPTLSKGIDLLLRIVDIIPKLDFSPITETIRDFLSAYKGFGDIISGLLNSIGIATDQMTTFQGVINGVALSFRVVSTPLRLLLAGLKTLGETISSLTVGWLGFGDVMKGAITFDAGLIVNGIDRIKTNFTSAFDQVKKNIKDFAADEADFYMNLGFNKDSKSDNSTESIGLSSVLSTPTANKTESVAKKENISSSISGSAPKNVTLNIQKLVENINFHQQNFQQNKQQMVEEIKKALLISLNDTVIAAG